VRDSGLADDALARDILFYEISYLVQSLQTGIFGVAEALKRPARHWFDFTRQKQNWLNGVSRDYGILKICLL